MRRGRGGGESKKPGAPKSDRDGETPVADRAPRGTEETGLETVLGPTQHERRLSDGCGRQGGGEPRASSSASPRPCVPPAPWSPRSRILMNASKWSSSSFLGCLRAARFRRALARSSSRLRSSRTCSCSAASLASSAASSSLSDDREGTVCGLRSLMMDRVCWERPPRARRCGAGCCFRRRGAGLESEPSLALPESESPELKAWMPSGSSSPSSGSSKRDAERPRPRGPSLPSSAIVRSPQPVLERDSGTAGLGGAEESRRRPRATAREGESATPESPTLVLRADWQRAGNESRSRLPSSGWL